MRIVLFIGCFFSGLSAFSQNYYDNRLSWLLKMHQTETKGNFWYSNTAYNIADIYAIKNNKDSAFYHLFDAINSCPDSVSRCAETYDADVLGNYAYEKWHHLPEWKTFEKRIREGFFKVNSKLKEPELAYKILIAKGLDQSLRFNSRGAEKKLLVKAVNKEKENRRFIKNHILQNGYPSVSQIGNSAVEAVFLICLHADDDIAFQKKVLMMMKSSEQPGISNPDIAYLTDRIMVAEEGIQLYGTQFKSKKELYPIHDSADVDKRRKAMGLSSLSEYLRLAAPH